MEEQRQPENYPVYNMLTTKGWLWIAIVATLATMATVLTTNSYNTILRDQCGAGIVTMELAETASSANAIINKWQQAPRNDGEIPCLSAAKKLQQWDWLLIITYTITLIAVLMAISHRLGLKPTGKVKVLFLIPFAIAGFDILENSLMAIVLNNPGNAVDWVVTFMSVAAVFKFVLLIILLLILAYLCGCWLMSRGHTEKETETSILRSLKEVIAAEQRYIQFRRKKAAINDQQTIVGFASSGGGIRSATVNLGVIERLLDVNLLKHVDYHATVSGGGYIGSALASLLSFKRKQQEQNPADPSGTNGPGKQDKEQYQFGPHDHPHFDCAIPSLRPFPLSDPGYVDAEPTFLSRGMVLNHLRSFGDFLVRRRRFLSRDVLRAVGTVVTGMSATLGMFILATMLISATFFCLLTLVDQGQEGAKLGFSLDPNLSYFKDFALQGWQKALPLGFLSTLILLMMPAWLPAAISEEIFTRDGDTVDDCRQYRQLWIIGAILVLSAFIFPHHLPGKVGVLAPAAFLTGASGAAAISYLLLCLTDDAFRFWALPDDPTRENRSLLSAMFGLTLAMTLLTASIGLLPWLVLLLLNPTGDAQKLITSLGTTSSTGLFSAILAGLIAWYQKASSAVEKQKRPPEAMKFFQKAFAYAKSVVLAIPILLLVIITTVVSAAGVAWIANNLSFLTHGFLSYAFIVMVLTILLLLIGYGVDFNKLSLHYFYRDRLAEAYLATYGPNPQQPDSLEIKRDNIEMQLTDLHGSCARTVQAEEDPPIENAISLQSYGPSDNTQITSSIITQSAENRKLTPKLLSNLPLFVTFKKRLGIGNTLRDEYLTDAATSAPYHLYCACLNLTTDRNMALRTRKSDTFVFSKLYCGSKTTSFLPTCSYRRGKTKMARAMTISGAAVDSTLGRNTFFAQSFATTLFNVRLGQWLENPGYNGGIHAHKQENLVFWPLYLGMEALGMSDSRRRLIHLSDGGHTGDNLGLLPLFDRHCGLIIAVDAEADPEYEFGSLLTALSYLQTDAQARVRLDLTPITPDPQSGLCQAPFVLGEIEYLDTLKNVSQRGCLLVLKSAVTKQMSLLLQRHKKKFPDFPQETTADQFFCEDQFEAYRQLGREIANVLFGALPSLTKANFDCQQLLEEYIQWQKQFEPKTPDHST
ncbi:hypothetical protein [Desulfopila aestuarii]|uniref:Patatin-like phospholipase n=1 Tax=Desulfopila aestuarii DSM 18488 TaxID=1121416 RepID=A0A1M7Y0A5_9BACT|nr:hypothetical protein [Desulfopila aestuarii]SHO44843.1 Patatin-like phospholipase [Desulfopila aestuarii DSM 18488]